MALRPRLAPNLSLALALALAASTGCDRARPAEGDGSDRCVRCHGGDGSAAPPRSPRGATATTDRGVGAHRAHLGGGRVRAGVACAECHVVPDRVDGHFGDPGGRATVAFAAGGLGRGAGAAPEWQPDAAGGPRCAGTYCHGATLAGGADAAPIWTRVDGTQIGCGGCHGAPPPAPHPFSAPGACHRCHPDTVREDGTIDLAGARHLDGRVDVGALGCTDCHGDGTRAVAPAAPPAGTRGEAATTDRAVGAHQAHLVGGRISGPVRCEACHAVPADLAHVDGVARVDLGEEARRGGAAPEWQPDAAGGARCAGTYCHGATLGAGGAATAPVWTQVDGAQVGCGGCHASPPTSAGHPQGDLAARCALCHPTTVLASGAIDVAGGHHIDGRLDVVGGACGGCHGAPPASGAHALHATVPEGASPAYGGLGLLEDVSPGGGPAYAFGCGHCHPIDPARHMDGRVDVSLAPDGAPTGALKARNAAAAGYDAGSGTCSGVYCHSSGQQVPAYALAPAWLAAPGALGCAGCHGNPPAYPTGGPGAADANGHLGMSTDGYEWGHFGGLPGPWHTSKHGGGWSPDEDAAPITCQACHAETTAGAGPSGFYWLDTTGTYTLPGGRLQYGCSAAACHGGAAAAGRGAVAPLRHVNGRRDVAFDARAALPALPWLPPAPDLPTRPYWVTNAAPGSIAFPDPTIPDAVMEGATLSLHLGSARYDPATKTCSTVGCHLQQLQVTWGAPHTGWGTCRTCHGF